MTLLAHTGHWLLDLAYLAPFVGLLLWLGLTMLRERRRPPSGERGEEPEG